MAERLAEVAASPERLEDLRVRAFEFARTQTWRQVAGLCLDLCASAQVTKGSR